MSWKKSRIIGQDVICERYKIPPHMLFYSEANGVAHNRGMTYPLMKCTDETGSYNGLPTLPPDGWDEVRQPFAGANTNWERIRHKDSRRNRSRKSKSHAELMSFNTPWRTPEGDTQYSIAEMDRIRSEILD